MPAPPPVTLAEFTDADLRDLLMDMCVAEASAVPGIARQAFVIAHAAMRAAKSPPPVWIWLIVVMLEKIIPVILDWLKKKYGDDWPTKTIEALSKGRLPWQT